MAKKTGEVKQTDKRVANKVAAIRVISYFRGMNSRETLINLTTSDAQIIRDLVREFPSYTSNELIMKVYSIFGKDITPYHYYFAGALKSEQDSSDTVFRNSLYRNRLN